MLVLEILTKNGWYSWRDTRILVPRTLVLQYFWVWRSCWWTLTHAGSVILRTENVKNLYLNLENWKKEGKFLFQGLFKVRNLKYVGPSEGHQNSGLSWKYMSKQLIMLRFYHETFALAPKLWCRHIYFYLFVGGGGYLSAPACLCSFFNHDNTPLIFQENISHQQFGLKT